MLIEAKHRRGELAMYVLPKGLESAWVAARGKGLVFRTGKHGNALVKHFCSIGKIRVDIDASLVDRDWDGNGHGTFHGDFDRLSALNLYVGTCFRARIRFVISHCLLFDMLIIFCLKNDPQHLSGFVRRILYQFIGPN